MFFHKKEEMFLMNKMWRECGRQRWSLGLPSKCESDWCFFTPSFFGAFPFYSNRLLCLTEPPFCICSLSLRLCSHLIWLKIALWQTHVIRLFCVSHQKNIKCPYKSYSDPRNWASFLPLSPNCLCLYPTPTKCWNFCSYAFSLLRIEWNRVTDAHKR